MPMALTSLRIFYNELCKKGLKLGLKWQQVGMVAQFPKVNPKCLGLLQMGVGTKYLNITKQTKEVCIWRLTPMWGQALEHNKRR